MLRREKKNLKGSSGCSAFDQHVVRGPHIGIDEAGRGCLAGPVVAAAVLFPQDYDFSRCPGLGDSKSIPAVKRKTLAAIIVEDAVYGIGVAWQTEVDSINILNATFRAMARAAHVLAAKLERGCGEKVVAGRHAQTLPKLIIDGNKIIPENAWKTAGESVPVASLGWEQYFPLPVSFYPGSEVLLPEQQAVVGGDALVPAVSAASIVAKTVRDGMMQRLDEFYPEYGFARHKGYGTREHLAALKRKGPCPLHRMTFRKVRPEKEERSEEHLRLL